ncbi:MAG: hypothetical protein ACM3ML_23890 [Micromonosporaceae bacterium]
MAEPPEKLPSAESGDPFERLAREIDAEFAAKDAMRLRERDGAVR